MIKINGQSILQLLLLVGITASWWSLAGATTTNPGHPWSQIGDGYFLATGPTVPRVYTFPNADTSVLTTAELVSVSQGGIGTSSVSGVLLAGGTGTSPLVATTAPSGVLVDNSSSQTLTNKTIDITKFYGYGVEDYEGYTGYYGGLLKSNGTKFVRMNLGSALQVLRTNATSSNLEWVNNPSGPAGSNQELQYNNAGSLGSTSSLTWDNSNRNLKLAGVLALPTSSDPSTASTGTLKLVNNKIGNREFLKVATRWSGDQYTIQQSLFQNFFIMFASGSSATMTNIGANITSNGTLSHPTATEVTGIMTNFVTAATMTSTAGLYNSVSMFYRGSTSGINGFFMFTRVYFPDNNYNQSGASTGSRIFAGLASGGIANWAISDNPSGHAIGFSRNSTDGGRQDSNWTMISKDNSTLSLSTTTMGFATSTVYDLYLYCPPQATEIAWRIDNLATGTSSEGIVNQNLPGASNSMQAGFNLGTLNAVARNVRAQKFYVEVPR